MGTYQSVLDALGDPTRRAIVDRLRAGPCSVGDLAGDMPVSTVCDRSRIGTDRSVLTLERLAARVHRSSGCRFQLVLAEQTRRPRHAGRVLTVP